MIYLAGKFSVSKGKIYVATSAVKGGMKAEMNKGLVFICTTHRNTKGSMMTKVSEATLKKVPCVCPEAGLFLMHNNNDIFTCVCVCFLVL